MGFTTNTFLFLFLPITIMIYFALYHYMNKKKDFTVGNVFISFASFIFYSWTLYTNAVMLFLFVIIIFMFGKLIEISRNVQFETDYYVENDKRIAKIKVSTGIVAVGITLLVYVLFHFKYLAIVASVVSRYFYVDANKYANITVPIGISFIIFSAISYLADIYRNQTTAGSFFDCFLYMFYFPKIISGPIVRWKDFQPQIKCHTTNTNEFVDGINRIIIGLAKKTILADVFGEFVTSLIGIPIDSITACMGWLAYALQIYYDFSGYSDIAIGLSRIFGIRINENFNFPYRSLSISEFWRRWHISLGSFFREYVYIPLGGNRKGTKRMLINLAIVFILTGVWHGTGIAYIIWGIMHGAFVIFERTVQDKIWYKRIPQFIKWFLTFILVSSLWQLFRFGDLKQVLDCFKLMIGLSSYPVIVKTWQYYATNRLIVFLVIGMIGSTVLGNKKLSDFYARIKGSYFFYLLQEMMLFGLLILSISFMINSTYSPFIYFQF